MEKEELLAMAKSEKFKFLDLRFTDLRGKEQHVSIPSNAVENALENGKMFDGSSIAGWRGIEKSDMILRPDVSTCIMDPFYKEPTMIMSCDVIDPETMFPYKLDPRSIAKAAEDYLKQTGIADTAYFGPEAEFFIFDDVRWAVQMNTVMYEIDSVEAAWNSSKCYPEGNTGHRPPIKGGYFPVPPVDSGQDIRSEIATVLKKMGQTIEAHHHEVATAGQHELASQFNTVTRKADELQQYKYVVLNVAHQCGKTATFMPKPLTGDNGNGMHCHQSLSKEGHNLFAGDGYADLSKLALSYIAGIIKHARALNAFTNSTTNSYKRLVPGFEAPIMLAYSACNRSASIRIPYAASPKGRRIEVRFPDTASNPYLAFAAMLMAGIDGIKNNLCPGDPEDKNLYELSKEDKKRIPTICSSLDQALEHLIADKEFLLQGGVFTEELLDSYIALKREEITRLLMATHPIEFEMYYSV